MSPADTTLFGVVFPPSPLEAGLIIGAALCLARAFLGGRKS